jgi:hypothetical protein
MKFLKRLFNIMANIGQVIVQYFRIMLRQIRIAGRAKNFIGATNKVQLFLISTTKIFRVLYKLFSNYLQLVVKFNNYIIYLSCRLGATNVKGAADRIQTYISPFGRQLFYSLELQQPNYK